MMDCSMNPNVNIGAASHRQCRRNWRLDGRGVMDSVFAAAFSRTDAESSAAAIASSRFEVDMYLVRITWLVRRANPTSPLEVDMYPVVRIN